jgi:molybdopterin-guanine dinucleotide biosynthesis protein A
MDSCAAAAGHMLAFVNVRTERSGVPAGRGPVGAVLAGGEGRRIGGDKSTVKLRGRPLISYPLDALEAVLEDVAVVAKARTELPPLPGVTVWIEPQELGHPLVGIVHALAMADGRAVVVCAVDLPFVTPAVVATLASADAEGAPAVIATASRAEQPLLGRYEPEAAALLSGALRADPGISLREAVAGIGPRRLELEDPGVLYNVNAPEDLLQAAALLDRAGHSSSRR